MIVELLVALVVILALIWGTQRLIAAFGVADPLATVIYVAVVLVVLFVILSYLGVMPTGLLRR